MQQLSGLDASFVYFETPSRPMHVAGISIYAPSTAPGGKEIRAGSRSERRRTLG